MLWGRVHSCTWAEGSHLQLPAGLHPQATTPNSLQSGHAAHRCGAAKTRNLLSHSCLGGKKRRTECSLAANLRFLPHRLPGQDWLLPCSAGRSAHLEPHPCPRFGATVSSAHRQPQACGSGDGHSPAPGRPVPPLRVSWFYRTF